MTTLKFTKTAFAIEAGKGIAFFLALCSLVFFTLYRGGSRNQSDTKEATRPLAAQTNKAAGAAGPVDGAFLISNDLYTLYIENRAGSEQLKKLLGNDQKQKLVLQLYRNRNGYLQLMAFPSTPGNGKYFVNDAIELSRSNIKDITMPEEENIFFGDLQVANKPGQQKWTIRDLKAHLYDSNKPGQNAGWEYILLVPKIMVVSEETYRRKYIVYELKRSDVLPQVSSQKAFTRIVPLDDDANPSPPRKME